VARRALLAMTENVLRILESKEEIRCATSELE